MAVPFNSVLGFGSTVNYRPVLPAARISTLRSLHLTSSTMIGGLVNYKKKVKLGFFLVANDDRVVTESSNTTSRNTEISYSKDGSSVNFPTLDSSNRDDDFQPKAEEGSESQVFDGTRTTTSDASGPQLTELPDKPMPSASLEHDDPSANHKPTLKRSSLTAREKLRAARVLSRYAESKATKPPMGSKLLDVLRESDKGKKRSGLPEAPTNLFDDSKRGLPKPGWTFEFPGGADMFLIGVSFVLISTIMFATTYIVWKVGAIHFNEY